jgi:hypothetical protein
VPTGPLREGLCVDVVDPDIGVRSTWVFGDPLRRDHPNLPALPSYGPVIDVQLLGGLLDDAAKERPGEASVAALVAFDRLRDAKHPAGRAELARAESTAANQGSDCAGAERLYEDWVRKMEAEEEARLAKLHKPQAIGD